MLKSALLGQLGVQKCFKYQQAWREGERDHSEGLR